jgi:drug/metabolite transporter (DMT)-like permease
MTEISYALAVLSSITYGAADFLCGLAAKRSTTFSVVVVSQLAGLILMLFSLPFLPPASPTAIDIAWGVASGLAGGIGVALLYRGLAIGVMSVVAPVTAVCAVIIPLVAGLVLGERPTALALVGVLLAIMAIVLVSQSGHIEEGNRATTGLGIAIASGFAIGIFLVFLQRTGPSAGLWPLITARGVSVAFFTAGGLISRETLIPWRNSMLLVIGGVHPGYDRQHPLSACRPAGAFEHRGDSDFALSGQHDHPSPGRPARTPPPAATGRRGLRRAGHRADRVCLTFRDRT